MRPVDDSRVYDQSNPRPAQIAGPPSPRSKSGASAGVPASVERLTDAADITPKAAALAQALRQTQQRLHDIAKSVDDASDGAGAGKPSPRAGMVGAFTARAGSLLLSAHRNNLDLSSSTAKFIVRVSGAGGGVQLSFASGTSLTSVRDAINSFADATGVTARLDGSTRIRFSPQGHGLNEFVSISILQDGGIAEAGVRAVRG